MASKLRFDPNEAFLQAVQANLKYWITQNNNISKEDQPNLRRVVKYGFEATKTFEYALWLTDQSIPLIEMRGDAREWLEIIDQAVKYRKTCSANNIGKLFNIQGNLSFSSGQFSRAIAFHYQAISLANQLQDQNILFNAFLGICHSKWGLRQFDLAKEFGEKALRLNVANMDLKIRIAKIYNILGMISFSELRNDEAWAYFQKAKRLYIENKDQAGRMRVENNLAILDQHNGKYESALKRFNKVINFFKMNNAEVDLVKAEVARGLLYYWMGNLEQSKMALLSAIPAGWEVSASGFHSAWINTIIGTIELTQNNPDLSRHYFLESLKYWKKTNNSEMIVLLNDRLTG